MADSADSSQSAFPKIELVWPGKDGAWHPRQSAEGVWSLESQGPERYVCPLIPTGQEWSEGVNADPSLVVIGERIESLRTLARGAARAVKMAYLDTPRVEVDDQAAAFRGDSTYIYSTWLSVLRAHVQYAQPLLARDGVLIVHTGDNEEPYARILLDEFFGRANRVATIVWQRAYAPRNMKGMREFTATHDCLLVYAMDKPSLPPVALSAEASGFRNPDSDPRGAWKAEHKGAHSRRAKSDFDTFGPPYRWALERGRLPEGLWRINPSTGMIWGIPLDAGEFSFEVSATDAKGASTRRTMKINIFPEGEPPEPPSVPWLFEQFKTSGRLRISKTLPSGVIGVAYSAICLAEGGDPHSGPPRRPRSGRYWEFADNTLLKAYQEDRVYLGRDGNAIPHPKSYLRDTGETVSVNQVTWWPGRQTTKQGSTVFAGYTEDATKHLKKMAEQGLISRTVGTAKPEHLLARLVDIFTLPNDLVLEVFGGAGDLAAVAIKRGRRFVFLAGDTERDRELTGGCVLPRLSSVVAGRDQGLTDVSGEIRMREDAYIPYAGGGRVLVVRMGAPLLAMRPEEEFARMVHENYSSSDETRAAILGAEGFIPEPPGTEPDGTSIVGRRAAVVVPAERFLTPELASELVSKMDGRFEQLVIYYFRASEDLDPASLMAGTVTRRVPTELKP